VPAGELVAGPALTLTRPVTELRSGPVTLSVAFQPAPGRKLDDRFGPSTRVSITASPPELLRSGAGESTELVRILELAEGDGVLHITAQAASCDADAEHPACYLARQDWGVPVRTSADAPAELRLALLD
jgi:hypothetical protein